MTTKLKYLRKVDVECEDSGAKLVKLVNPKSSVLEIGPGSGFMTKYMTEVLECEVSCVELDPAYVELVSPLSKKTVHGNIETVCLWREFQAGSFDYLVFADVLEHLLDPAKTLERVIPFLKFDGELLISIPNISYAGVICELMQGVFTYRDVGLLDCTHLRFFTRGSLWSLLNSVDLVPTVWDRVVVSPSSSEFAFSLDAISGSLKRLVELNSDWDTYQFIVSAKKREAIISAGIDGECKPVFPALPLYNQRLLQIFWGTRQGYSEEMAFNRKVLCDSQVHEFKFEIISEDPIISLRLDPSDAQDFIEIDSLQISDIQTNELLFDFNNRDARRGIGVGLVMLEATFSNAGNEVYLAKSGDSHFIIGDLSKIGDLHKLRVELRITLHSIADYPRFFAAHFSYLSAGPDRESCLREEALCLQNKIEQQLGMITDREQSVVQLEAELKNVEEHARSIESCLREEALCLQNKIEQQLGMITDREQSVAQLEAELKKVEEHARSVESCLREEARCLQNKIEQQLGVITDREHRAAQLEVELRKVGAHARGVEASFETAMEILAVSEDKIREAQREQSSALRQKDHLLSLAHEREESFRKEIRKLKSESKNLKSELENLRNTIKSVLSSTSWKLTEPLRRLMSKIRNLKVKRILRPLNPFYWFTTGQFSRLAETQLKVRSETALVNELAEIEAIMLKSGIFDKCLYKRNSPSCCSTGLSEIQHYLRHGITEGREPCEIFDTKYYLSQFDSKERKVIKYPLYHYITTGAKLGKNPHPLFFSSYYVKAYLADSSVNPLGHFLTEGYKRHNSPHPMFDTMFYFVEYPDVVRSGINPLVHYLRFGEKEGRDPSPYFSPQDYKELYPDVVGCGKPLLEHYVLYGQKENRLPAYPDLVEDDYFSTPVLTSVEKYLNVIDVIIPVYRGLEETQECIESVLCTKTDVAFRLIVINDCSPEPELVDYLKSVHQDDRLLVLHNDTNLGFVGTVNKGMMLNLTRDVILLNSDTVVSDYWLDRILAHSIKDPKIATITPVSNNATICSYPRFEGSQFLPSGETVESMSELCYAVNSGRSVDVPTGVGYCMYIRRESLNDLGYFDQEAFGKGYGEENDFCLRASKNGWRNIHALDVYVYHRGEVSFKEDSSPSKIRAQSILAERYPDYSSRVARFVKEDPSKPFRCALTARRLAQSKKPCVLLVEHAFGGGTQKHTKEIVERFKDRVNYIILRPILKGKKRNTIIFSAESELNLEVKFNSETDFDFIVEFLKSCGVVYAHVHHLLGFSLDVRKLLSKLEVAFDFTVHDYFTICPQKNLLDETYHYCGEPALDGCNRCIAQMPNSGANDITNWRESWGWFIRSARRVICPSYDVAERMSGVYPTANYLVVPHEASDYVISEEVCMLPRLNENQSLRVGILGVLAPLKGFHVVEELAAAFAESCYRSVELICIGYTEKPALLAPAVSLYQTGSYADVDLDSLIQKNNLHVIWFPADWPETYSYTLSAALRSKLPIIAPRLGAFTERLTGRRNTWLVEPNRNVSWWTDFFKNLRGSEISCVGKGDLNIASVRERICIDFYDQRYVDFDDKEEVKTKITSAKTSRKIINLILDGSRDVPNSCGYIRLLLPLKHEKLLKEFDVRVMRKSELRSAEGDIFIAQRLSLKDPVDLENLHEVVTNRKIKFIYEIDDDLIDLPNSHPEKGYYDRYSRSVIEQLQLADQVWVSTPSLATKCMKYSEHVKLNPNYLDERLWLTSGSKCPGGWFTPKMKILYMGTLTHKADFAVIKRAIQEICKEFSESVEFCVIGIDENLEEEGWYTRVSIPKLARSSYPAFVNWLTSVNDFAIGVAPLVDNDFNRSKSGLKFLDYSAMGLCSICSDVESYRSLVVHGHNGFLISNSEEEWYEGLRYAISNHKAIGRMRLIAHRELRDKYTIGANVDGLIDLMRSL